MFHEASHPFDRAISSRRWVVSSEVSIMTSGVSSVLHYAAKPLCSAPHSPEGMTDRKS